MQPRRRLADIAEMERKILWMCIGAGSTAGGFVPGLWGAGQLSMASMVFSVFGGVAGFWLARRIDASL
jgi:hypothetical protein